MLQGLVTMSAYCSQGNLAARHIFGWAFVLCGGVGGPLHLFLVSGRGRLSG